MRVRLGIHPNFDLVVDPILFRSEKFALADDIGIAIDRLNGGAHQCRHALVGIRFDGKRDAAEYEGLKTLLERESARYHVSGLLIGYRICNNVVADPNQMN